MHIYFFIYLYIYDPPLIARKAALFEVFLLASVLSGAFRCQATINPTQTLFDVKRLIGRRFKDSTVQKDIKLLPYAIATGRTCW